MSGKAQSQPFEMLNTGTLLCSSRLYLDLGFHTHTSAVDFLLVTISKRPSKGSEVLPDASHKANPACWTRETCVFLRTGAKTRVEAIAGNTVKGIQDS